LKRKRQKNNPMKKPTYTFAQSQARIRIKCGDIDDNYVLGITAQKCGIIDNILHNQTFTGDDLRLFMLGIKEADNYPFTDVLSTIYHIRKKGAKQFDRICYSAIGSEYDEIQKAVTKYRPKDDETGDTLIERLLKKLMEKNN